MKRLFNITLFILIASLTWAQGSAENDLTLSDVSYANYQPDTDTNYRHLAYSIYHYSQIRPLTFSGTATNSGSHAQTGVQLKVIVSNDLGYSDTFFSDTLSLAPGMAQEIHIPEYMPPNQTAHYSISYELLSDSLDENPADNFGEKEFEISEVEFARDRGASEGAFTDFVGEYELGAFFHIDEISDQENVWASCIHVALSNLSETGVFVEAILRDSEFNFITQTSPVPFNGQQDFNEIGQGKYRILCLKEPIQLQGNKDYFISFHHFGGADLAVLAIENDVESNSSFFYDYAQDEWVALNVMPMIRFGLGFECLYESCVSTIEDNLKVSTLTLYPNPATYQITLEYTLLESTPLEIRITDVNGRVVHHENTGKLSVGEHRSEFNIQHLPPGVYALNLIHNGEVISNKFVVQR